MKKVIRNFLILQGVVLLIMFFYYKEYSITSYINGSFIIGGTITFIGLISFIFSTGFFDFFAISMRKVLTPKHRMEDVLSMRKPSEVFSAPVLPLLGSGVLTLAVMAIVLLVVYV